MPLLARTLIALIAINLLTPCRAQKPVASPRIVVFVIDGLRPDQITAKKMPSLYRFQQEGVAYLHAHSTFPTVTRVNASTISTGVYPDTHGILSNSLYLPTLSRKSLSTGDEQNLLKLASLQHDRILHTDSLSEILTRAGKRFVAISSGSNGGATLLAPEARHGVATLINAGLDKGKRLAYPQSVEDAIRARFGFTSAHEGLSSVEWTERVLREYVVPELHPDVIIDWITEPDTTQHKYGIGSPEALHALTVVDRNFSQFLKTLADRGELDSTDIFITADHGFATAATPLDLAAPLAAAGLTSATLGILNDGQTASFYLQTTDPALRLSQLRALTNTLQQQPNVDLLFTRSAGGDGPCKAGATIGSLPGTLALEAIHQCAVPGPDLLIASSWSDRSNSFGEPGFSTQVELPPSGEKAVASHGGLSEWTVHTPLLLHGPHFAQHLSLDLPSANIDIPATLAYLLHVPLPQAQGRPLLEAMRDTRRLPGKPHHRTITTHDHGVTRTLAITTYKGEEYLDRSSRAARAR